LPSSGAVYRPFPSSRGWASLVAILCLVCRAGFSAEEKGKEKAPRTLSAMEKDLRQAMAAQDPRRAQALLDEMVATGDPQAYDMMIKHALTGVSYAIEKHAGSLLLGAKDPKVRDKILAGCLKNPNHKTRIILLAVAARLKDDPKVVSTIQAAVKDPMKPVAFAALQWIRELNRKECVEPLIAELGVREKKGADRLYFDIRRTLKHLTSFDLESAKDWENFWEAQKQGLMKPAKPVESRTTLVKRPSFFSVMVDSDRVLFVIDVSKSMDERDPFPEGSGKQAEGSKSRGETVVAKKQKPKETPKAAKLPLSRERLTRVKEELIRVVSGLPVSTQFGILSFSHELAYVWDARVLRNATQENRAAAVNWVKNLKPYGATRTDLALKEALSVPEVDTIIVLTDGAPRDEKNKPMEIQPILAFAKEANRFVRARILTISFQQIRDKDMVELVRELARQNDGGAPTLLP